MATPKYFSNFPNIDYANAVNKAGVQQKIAIKDYFHLLRIKDEVYSEANYFYTYTIQYGERPEQVSLKEYGSDKYYWLVLNANDITDVYNQWPLSTPELDDFIIKKYGSVEASNEIHHYETREVLDEEGQVLMKAGYVVDEDYVFEYEKISGSFLFFNEFPASVTNLEYEYQQNDKKMEIQLLNKKYVFQAEIELNDYGMKISRTGLHSNLNIADYYK